jgi:ABC-type dipeptide/oligopeptide/nickel transport system permease subunit
MKESQFPGKKTRKGSVLLETLGRMVKSPSSRFGTTLFFLIIIACFMAPIIAPYGENEMDIMHIRSRPNMQHIFGTDALGRDILSRLFWGGRYSLLLGLCASLYGNAIGAIIGCVAGYFGDITESLIMRLMDIWSSIPGILLCILVSTVLGPGFFNTVFAISIGGVPGGVRMTRGQILAERSKEYIEAAMSINCPKISIMFKHLLPNVISPTIVGTTMGIGGTITAAAGLSYIGLGVQPPLAEWGAMLADGRGYIREFPHLIVFPGLAIAFTVLAVNLMGDGLRDALDPKLRS